MNIVDLIGSLTWGQYRCENPCYEDYNPWKDGPHGTVWDKEKWGQKNVKSQCDQNSPGNKCTKDECLRQCQKVPGMTCCEYHETGDCIAELGPCAANPENNKEPIDPRPGEYMCATKGKKIEHDIEICSLHLYCSIQNLNSDRDFDFRKEWRCTAGTRNHNGK